MSRGFQYAKVGSRKNELIRAILMNGFIPGSCLNMFQFPVHKMRLAARELIKDGIISAEKTPNGKKIFVLEDFKKNSAKYEKGLPPGYLERYEYITSAYRWEVMKDRKAKGKNGKTVLNDMVQRRLFRFAQTNMFFYWSGIPTYMDQRRPFYADGLHSECAYFPSNELREKSEYTPDIDEASKAVSASRITGLLKTKSGIYGVYNYNNTLIKFAKDAERNICMRLENVIHSAGIKSRISECIVLYSSVSMLHKIYSVDERNGYNIETLSEAYRNAYAIPTNEYGKEMIRLMSGYGWKRDLITRYIENKHLVSAATRVPCDGFDKENQRYTLVYCVPDILKLIGFLSCAKEFSEYKFTIHCFDWQEDFIESVTDESVEIVVHEF